MGFGVKLPTERHPITRRPFALLSTDLKSQQRASLVSQACRGETVQEKIKRRGQAWRL